MFRFFESLVDPYPMHEPEAPPRRLWAFVLHYSRPVLPWLVAPPEKQQTPLRQTTPVGH